MGYSWYRTDSAYHRHPKMLALRAELKQPLADAYVSRLWSWTQVYAPDGRISVGLIGALEAELGWTDSSGSLAAALEKTGWLERHGDVLLVHDWPEYQGYLVKKAKKDADKKRKRRARDGAKTAPSVRADGAAPSPRTAPPTDGRTDVTDVTNGTDTTNGDFAPRAAPSLPPRSLVDLWNSAAAPTLPRAELTGKRKTATRLRLAERTLEQWRAVIERINASKFCLGENERGWRANYDWLVRPDTAAKVLEGQYDRPTKPVEPKTVYASGSVKL